MDRSSVVPEATPIFSTLNMLQSQRGDQRQSRHQIIKQKGNKAIRKPTYTLDTAGAPYSTKSATGEARTIRTRTAPITSSIEGTLIRATELHNTTEGQQ